MKLLWITAAAVLTALTSAALHAPSQGSALGNSAPSPARLANSQSGPVVAELFTSQGCSSCPPADAVAARLARDPAILVISRPVTYWDRLGWKDSLGREENTRLQRQYGDRAFAGANIYTPQLVIDGSAQGVGSQEAHARKQIARAGAIRARSGVTVRVARTADGGRSIVLQGRPGTGTDVMLIALSSRETVKIGRGENGGRSVSYTNVVLDETPLGSWSEGRRAIVLSPDQLDTRGADRHALVIRRGAGGAIIGSALI
ncbi:DUF1223 domain-containing protein [Blastomonas fulva]|jgi:hypothetical protein|uniref:DUF1223 domain-containing protein n=1 Tax=Blastomonas fulva TaxID=1550728 RepID=UPI003D2DD83F